MTAGKIKKNKVKIIIIEDDPLLVRVYQEAFLKRGYEVETFFSGEDAYEALVKMAEKPTVIVSDIMMPGMDGLEFLKKLKESPELKKIPVILSTNLAQVKYAEKGLGMGAIAYLVKGQYTMRELVDKIEDFIQARKESIHASTGEDIPEEKVPVYNLKKHPKE